MLVRDLMEKDVLVVRPESDCSEALKMMQEKGVGCVVVRDLVSVVGVLTDRDLLIRGHDDNECFAGHEVTEFMTTPAITISPDKDILEAVHVMKSKSVRRLPVIESGKLIGVVSWADLAQALGGPLHDLVTGHSKKTGRAVHA